MGAKPRLPGGGGGLGGVRDVSTSEIMRQLAQMVKIGKVSKVDAETGRYSIDYGDNKPSEIEGRTDRSGDDQTDDMHSEGEQVLVFNPGGDLGKGIILGALHKKGNKPFDKKEHKGRKYADGTVLKHDTKKKERTTTMKKGAKHALSVDKQKQTIDDKGTRLENDKAAVHVKPDGAIAKINQSGGVVLAQNGSVYINCG
jgi:phage baseplate assembly protein V